MPEATLARVDHLSLCSHILAATLKDMLSRHASLLHPLPTGRSTQDIQAPNGGQRLQ